MTPGNGSSLRAVPDSPPKAIAYIRVSQEREEMISPELQETAIRDHCARNGYQLGEIITDLDLSGRFWKRRQVERAIEMIEQKDADVIVVWKMSRVARNRLDWNIALDRVETVGGRLESATEPIDTSTSSGRFSRGILAELAAFESERAGEQWQETHRRRWSRGLPHNGKPRLGYTYTHENGFQPDPEMAPIVVELYARSTSGEGNERLASWLVSLGISSLTTGRGVAYYLRSGFAAGIIEHHDPKCTRSHRAGVRCANTIRERGAHEAIIDIATLDGYLAVSAARATIAPRLLSPVSALSGVVVCSSCGYRMSRKSRAGELPYFRCTGRGCSRPLSFKEQKAESLVREWLPTVEDLVNAASAKLGAGPNAGAVELDRLARIVGGAVAALEKMTVDFARGIIPEGAYLSARDSLEHERDDAAAAHRTALRASENLSMHAHAAASLMEVWKAASSEEKNRVIRNLCRVEVSHDGTRPSGRVFGAWE